MSLPRRLTVKYFILFLNQDGETRCDAVCVATALALCVINEMNRRWIKVIKRETTIQTHEYFMTQS